MDRVEQEYLAYLFLNNSNAKMHSQLKKDVMNYYSKGNTDAYPNNIHKALTLENKYTPLKLETPAVPAQGTAFVTKDQGGNKKGKGKTKYLKDTERNALEPLRLSQRSLKLARRAKMMVRRKSPWQAPRLLNPYPRQ
jgi:hypothetical protein